MNIRSRLRKDGIRCQPWRLWKGEIKNLPISAQTLFKNSGIPIDILERELTVEGWLSYEECLLDCLSDIDFLKRTLDDEFSSGFGLIPDDWTEEDFVSNGLIENKC